MFMAIVERAFGGRRARKLRAVFPERGLKGEKAAVTPVMYLVIILVEVVLEVDSRTRSSMLSELTRLGDRQAPNRR